MVDKYEQNNFCSDATPDFEGSSYDLLVYWPIITLYKTLFVTILVTYAG